MTSSGIFRTVVSAAGLGLLVYAGLVVYLWAAQDWLLFPGRASAGTRAMHLPEGAVELRDLRVGSSQLYGLYLPAEHAERALLFFGGNGEYVAVQVPELETLHDLGADVLAVDYPGYGGSEGHPSETSIAEAGLAAYDELARRAPGRPIAVIGRSLGSFAALHVAAEREVESVVLLAPFTSLRTLAARTMPFVPVRLLLRHRLDNLATLERVEVPIVVIHNRDDEIVPFEMGEAVAAAASESGKLVESDGGGHNSMAILPGTREAVLIAEVLDEAR